MNGSLGAFGLVLLAAGSAFADDLVSYDAARQAIAVDNYAGGFGRRIDIDFDAEHSAAGVIMQGLWHEEYGYATLNGVFRTLYSEGGSFTEQYGWGEILGDLAPTFDYASLVSTVLDDVTPAPEPTYYFTPEWDVAAGKTVVFVQPASSSQPIPVTEAMLANTFVRIDEGPWYRFDEVPQVASPLAVGVHVSPSSLNRKSAGPWVTARIALPAPYTVQDVDLESVVLTIDSVILVHGWPNNSVFISKNVTASNDHATTLIAKFGRQELMSWLPSGEATVHASGRLRDGTPIHGSTVLTLRD